MNNWTYLRFNSSGDPRKKNVYPLPKTFVWGFDLYDHQVKICYLSELGHSILAVEPGYLSDDCKIVAWAPIEDGKMQADLDQIKKCGIYWPPIGSLEYERKIIRIYSRMKPRSKRERQRINAILAKARSDLVVLTESPH